ncbi:MAG: quinolinate synthase NadA [Nitrospiria bacterium]
MSETTGHLIEKLNRLKKERRALILSHNYQVGEIQDVADFTGDSLELSQIATRTDAKVILFCGVHFMAETAALLNPDKLVLIPDLTAGCSMSDMITVEKVRELKARHPGAVVVCYVNTSAAVKAESDICCTSSNAAKVVLSIPPDREIIFIPDQYLGSYLSRQTGRKLILYDGYCPVHYRIMAADLEEVKGQHPDAEVVVHPECTPEVIAQADQVLSTSGISRAVRQSRAEEIIVGTEIGILHRLKKENPQKKIFAACQWCDCAHMKVNTLEKVLWSLEDMQHVVEVPEEIFVKARRAVERMMTLSG